MPTDHEALRESVLEKYAEIARSAGDGCCTGCNSEGDAADKPYSMIGDAYNDVSGYVADADLGLGCGLPVEHAALESGQTVLDLGSGAGLDAFVARHEVGETGHVIGVDMTPEMIYKSRENARQSGFSNVEFRLGEIEHLPVESGTVDVAISNCVLNLVPDKARAFAEIYRVLKPGGHFCISDVVSSRKMPDWAREIADAYAGCVSGTVTKAEYFATVENAGFSDISVLKERRIDIPADLLNKHLTPEQLSEIAASDLHVFSVTVVATKRTVGE